MRDRKAKTSILKIQGIRILRVALDRTSNWFGELGLVLMTVSKYAMYGTLSICCQLYDTQSEGITCLWKQPFDSRAVVGKLVLKLYSKWPQQKALQSDNSYVSETIRTNVLL